MASSDFSNAFSEATNFINNPVAKAMVSPAIDSM